MFASKVRAASIAVASTLALSACAMPYGGVGVGYGSGGYYGGYGSYGGYGDYGPYGYAGYGYDSYSPYGGWYDNYYYPGSGYYVYGRDGRRYRWTDSQRRYWETHRRDHRDKPSVSDVLSRPFERRIGSDGSTTTTATTSPVRTERRVRTIERRPSVERSTTTTRDRSDDRGGIKRRLRRKD